VICLRVNVHQYNYTTILVLEVCVRELLDSQCNVDLSLGWVLCFLSVPYDVELGAEFYT